MVTICRSGCFHKELNLQENRYVLNTKQMTQGSAEGERVDIEKRTKGHVQVLRGKSLNSSLQSEALELESQGLFLSLGDTRVQPGTPVAAFWPPKGAAEMSLLSDSSALDLEQSVKPIKSRWYHRHSSISFF